MYFCFPFLITSLKNSRIKDAVRLRERRGREQQGRMIVDGARPLQRALEAGVEIDVIFFCQELAVSVEATQVLAIAPSQDGAIADLVELVEDSNLSAVC